MSNFVLPGDKIAITEEYEPGKNACDDGHIVRSTVSGENVIKIQNTGQSELNAKGTLEKSQDPLFLTYHILVIIAGIVVIGFSAAFTVRKPRGF